LIAIRIAIEIIKLSKGILVLFNINGAFRYSENMKVKLGNIKFSLILQAVLSLAVCVPVIQLIRFIFKGFS
jgi:hypothetical protein